MHLRILALASSAIGVAHAGTVGQALGVGMPPIAHGQRCIPREEAVELDCTGLRTEGTCEVRHRLTLAADGPCTLLTRESYATAPTMDGVPMVRGPGPWRVPGAAVPDRRDGDGWIEVPDGVHLLARDWTVTRQAGGFGDIEPDRARHPLLHAGVRGHAWPLAFHAPPVDRRGSDYTLRVTVTPPRGVRAEPGDPRWTRDGDRWTAVVVPGPTESGEILPMRLAYGDIPLHHGGPQIGVGVAADAGGMRGLVRMEYEFGLWDHVLPGVSLESGPSWTLTPRVEVSQRARYHYRGMYDFFPYDLAWSAGLGMPLGLDGTPRGTVRALVGVHWLAIGLTATVDVPTASSATPSGSLTARLGL